MFEPRHSDAAVKTTLHSRVRMIDNEQTEAPPIRRKSLNNRGRGRYFLCAQNCCDDGRACQLVIAF